MRSIFRIPTEFNHQIYIKEVEVNLLSNGTTIQVESAYDADLIKEIKAMEGARWSPSGKYWTVSDNERNQFAIKLLTGDESFYNFPQIELANLDSRLLSHQPEGIEFILSRRRCMLAFEMGLGKTLTTLKALEEIYNRYGKKWWWLVAPTGAQKEWQRQIKKWGALIYPVVTTTYESLHKYMDTGTAAPLPHGIIFDESIKLKTPGAERSQVANELCRRIRSLDGYIILLSGSPAPQDPGDWWHQLECIQPGFIREGSVKKFQQRYANIESRDYGYGVFNKITGWKQDEVAKLGQRLAPLVLFKHKKDCLDLPDKFYDVIECSLAEHAEKLANIIVDCAASGLEALEKLRQLSDGFQYEASHGNSDDYRWVGSPKVAAVKELLNFYDRDNGGPGRIVIFAHYKATVKQLAVELQQDSTWSFATINSDGWSDKNILDKFEDPSHCINLGIIASPGCVHGLTLSQTQALVYYSNSFVTDHRIQSEERRDRPGMDTTKGTRIIDLIHLHTDRLVLDKLKKKQEVQSITLEELKKWVS